ncbi:MULTISPECIES: N-acetyltransferase [unclassified Fusibacter]|uniref:N-acetyltransferase n=1 Tax=unclassified Fusibacter TaxID=2624464 RepID=UPI0010117E99|nr:MULTISPECIES: N-acetyltransferase [unclassified Fusibacter]MCK8060098.1 N-acetyltransferase [Fusibacter sp. A2]NPE22240.1 GNAT family N-acetyltransferase [Fusibacter sp. A1]RXV61014.1 GNAT family N-acetyltransferase [Fusibacter sp. A1]
MKLITVNKENIANEHICCSIAEKKGETCIEAKKAWMMDQFDQGLVFTKLDVRGKVFIEYMPAENAWHPIDAPNYMVINCLWVSGKYKGAGHANELLDSCIEDARQKGKEGLVVVSSAKKKTFLSDPDYLRHKGFEVVDQAAPYFELYALKFDKTALSPAFIAHAKPGRLEEKHLILYYSNQCPFASKYANLLSDWALQAGIKTELRLVESHHEAQTVPAAVTNYALFYKGKFITNEILSEKKFDKLIVQSVG